MAEFIEVLEHPEIGFVWMAECEHCVPRHGDLRGCDHCEYRGYRRLTEDEEESLFGGCDPEQAGKMAYSGLIVED